MPFDILIANGILLTKENDYRPFIGSLGISGGKIQYIGRESFCAGDASETLDATDKIVMPGLINGHCHGDMTIARGLLDDMTLQEQNEAMAPTGWLSSLLDDDVRYLSRQLTYLEAIKSGTTFLCENMYWSLGLRSVDAMRETGLRGALCEDIRLDFSKPDELIDEAFLARFEEECRKSSLLPMLGTISEEDFTPSLLKKVTETVRKSGLRSTQHLSETTWRLALIQKHFGKRPVEFLFEQNALHSALIGSHAVYIEPDEIKLMKKAGVSVVNTPLCEMKIADGIAPVPQFLAAGIPVGLGTDGALWNNSNDLFREMKGVCLLHTIHSGIRTLSAKDALDMGTILGAKAFGLEAETGSLCVGKSADVILVETRSPHMQPLRLTNCENVASSVVFCATGQDVTDSVIGGRIVMKNRIVLTLDEENLLSRAKKAGEQLAKQLSQIGGKSSWLI